MASMDSGISEGDLVSIYGLHGEDEYRVAKVVATGVADVHLLVYRDSFLARPASTVESSLELPALASECAELHLPLSKKLFGLLRPTRLRSAGPIIDNRERIGYTRWMYSADGVLGHCLETSTQVTSKQLLTLFLVCFIPVFLLTFAFLGLVFGLVKGLGAGVAIGGAFGAIMVFFQLLIVQMGKRDKQVAGSVNLEQTRKLTCLGSQQDVLQVIRRILEDIDGCEIGIVDASTGIIEARVKTGNAINDFDLFLSIFSITAATTTVLIWSESLTGVSPPSAEHMANVNKIVEQVSKELSSDDYRDIIVDQSFS